MFRTRRINILFKEPPLCGVFGYANIKLMAKKKIKKDILTFNAVFSEEDTGGYSVSVPALPGCFSQGDDFEEAAKNIAEAIELYLEDEKDFEGRLDNKNKKEFLAPVSVYA